MGRLIAYNFVSLNGFFKGPNEDISWHKHAADESKYSEEMLALDNILLFGRKTYESMASFWPTPMAQNMFPKVAEGMNRAEKIVISNSAPKEEPWHNSRFIQGNVVDQIRSIKQAYSKDITILGSGSIINLFTDHAMIDEYQIMIDPVGLPAGTSLFNGISQAINLTLIDVKRFPSGVVLLCYSRSLT
ncbi:MAG TPA: dihydrofolate reductase family protein [Bacteroidales bacterium]|nr:dihydrofolate reductase family protein [Bacteroidales bacterium]